jgi:hypothetical protein
MNLCPKTFVDLILNRHTEIEIEIEIEIISHSYAYIRTTLTIMNNLITSQASTWLVTIFCQFQGLHAKSECKPEDLLFSDQLKLYWTNASCLCEKNRQSSVKV